MKFTNIAFLTACMLFGSHALAQDKDDHKAHHPGASGSATASASAAAKASKTTGKADTKMADPMAEKMKAMQEMHKKMMAAKTPEERQALMADHMKAMKEGMGMMAGMKMGGMKKDGANMPANMADRHQMMEKRMEMMETMMQMMMDRMQAGEK